MSDSVASDFKPVFVVYLLVCSLLTVFFLLYFNRVFASILSYGIRTWTWHRHRVYIDVQALQISLLGGRVFFTGLRYHGNNETFLVQSGHITWRYWLRRVREVDLGDSGTSFAKGGDGSVLGRTDTNAKLPCRINVSVKGLEWFVYNKTPAYDDIVAGLSGGESSNGGSSEKAAPTRDSGQGRKEPGEKSDDTAENGNGANGVSASRPARLSEKPRRTTSDSDADDGSDDQTQDVPFLLRFFPIHLECQKASMVMGNEYTPGIFVVKADSISGEIDAEEARHPDPYRQVFKIHFQHPIVEIHENEDYRGDQDSTGAKGQQQTPPHEASPRVSFFRKHRKRMLHRLRQLVPQWRRSVESFSADSNAPGNIGAPGHQWQGLSRYLNGNDEDDKTMWSSVQYAAISTVIDCPEASMSVYWDVVGKVPDETRVSGPQGGQDANINGGDPPAWGISLSLKGGIINYGPWADRHRADLQRVFFPSLCKDASPASPLKPGQYRVPTVFSLQIDLDEEVKVRVPIREESKNWKWRDKTPPVKSGPAPTKRRQRARQKKSKAADAAQLRPAGWLDVKVAANSTVSYSMDMVASQGGFSNKVDIDIPGTEVSSSVNHDLLWRSGRQSISCDLSAPLKWNGLRSWTFGIKMDALELFLLRDHVYLLIDLVDDWSGGPPAEYLTFTPFKYFIEMELRDLKIYVNVNDANIINKPTSFDDNTYMIFRSPSLFSTTCIPLDRYSPSKNAIPFEVRTDSLGCSLNAPQWSTQSSFLDSNELGHIENLTLDGRYHYNATTSTSNTDTLVLNVACQSPVCHVYGFVIRYFFNLKDNYFGDFVHFKTLEEYQETLQRQELDPTAEKANRPPHKKTNDMDVIMNIRADDPRFMIPANLFSMQRHVQIEIPAMSLDLRFTNYYMDMDMAVGPMSLSQGFGNLGTGTPDMAVSSTQLFVDGFHMYANRLFGLPPSEITYLCNYDVSVGAVSGECTAEFLSSLMRGGSSLGLMFDDEENALIPYSSLVFHDVSFLRLSVESVRVWLHAEEAAFLVSTGPVDVRYNDWARSHYSKRSDVHIPDITVSCVNSESAARHKSRPQHIVEPEALIKTSIHLATIGRKFNFIQERLLQQELVQREDQRTHRTPFFLIPDILDELAADAVDPPAQSVPPIPSPVVAGDDEVDQASMESSSSSASKLLSKKTSFLSVDSGASSVVRSRSPAKASRKPESIKKSMLQPGMSHDARHHRQGRDRSVSSGRHSAFYSAVGDSGVHKEQPQHSSVAFSSQYFPPYFPLENFRAELREGTLPPHREMPEDDASDVTDFGLEDVDSDMLKDDCSSSSLLLEFTEAVTAYFTPAAIRYVATLASALQPTEPDDVLDSIQLDAMGQVIDLKKQTGISGHIEEVMLKLPKASIRFLHDRKPEYSLASSAEQDQYDVTVADLAFMNRSSARWDNPFRQETRQERKALHFRLGSCELSVSERAGAAGETHAAVMAQVHNVAASSASNEVIYVDLDVDSIQASTASGEIEYLMGLIHRTTSLASDLGKELSRKTGQHQVRQRYFIYRLLTDSQNTVDPSFIVRPSAILRSAKQHLRTFDSWKLMARLRQIWRTAGQSYKDQLTLDCWGLDPDLPEDAMDQIIAAFHNWRSWDLEDIAESILLKTIQGSAVAHHGAKSNELPLLAACRLGELQILLDPGPKQNKMELQDVDARVEGKVNKQEGPGNTGELHTTVNVCCGEAGIFLNWELVEFLDDLMKIYGRSSGASRDQPPPAVQPSNAATPGNRRQPTLHVVAEVSRGTVEIETINLGVKGLTDGLTASALVQHTERGGMTSNLMVFAKGATGRLDSHAQFLGTTQLREPSIFVCHAVNNQEAPSSQSVKATASCQGLAFNVEQDPIVLLEIVDVLIKDEVSQLYRLKDAMPRSPEVQGQSKRSDRMSSTRVNLALFLNQYEISVPLLRSLTYSIRGDVARSAMAANFGREVIFDFDIKENNHEMKINVNNEPRVVSLLSIPPTNGRITSQMGSSETNITVLSTVELIRLDAHAVYSLLRALNRPQISNAVHEVKDQVDVIQTHLREVFGSRGGAKQPQASSGSKLVYAVRGAWAGLEVFGRMPLKFDADSMAHLLFRLDKIDVEVSNRADARGPILNQPEIHANFSQIGFDIERGRGGNMRSCGSLAFGATLSATTRMIESDVEEREFSFSSDEFFMEMSPDTVSTVVDILGYLGDKIKDIDTSRELDYLRKLRHSRQPTKVVADDESVESDILDSFLSSVVYHFEVKNIKVAWLVVDPVETSVGGKENLVLSVELVEFGTRTKKSARLTIQNFQLQMVPPGHDPTARSAHSALLPEVIFNVAHVSNSEARRFAFQAVGKSLDLRLTSAFILPAAHLQDSIMLSIQNVQQASEHWTTSLSPAKPSQPASESSASSSNRLNIFRKRRLESLLIDADFAGATVYISGKKTGDDNVRHSRAGRPTLAGKYGQFNTDDAGSAAVLRTPGLASKVEFRDNGHDDPSLYGEIKIDASNNILYPTVVPLMLEIMTGVKEVVKDDPQKPAESPSLVRSMSTDDDNILTADPSAVLGRLKLNLGLHIRRQEFSLSCQPIARVAATACFQDIYFTFSTVRSQEQGNFFAIAGSFRNLQASVQHVYSRESTGNFEVDSIVLSLMNSKHVSGTSGVSAILNVSPMKVSINAKQLQDFLLFREIWYPKEMRQQASVPVAKLQTETSQGHLVQRYQQVAATAAFPWTATVSIESLDVNVDLGQAIGKPVFAIKNFWVSSKKTSDWEQNLCLAFEKIGVDCTGRLSGFVELQHFKLRTSIQWPEREQALNETPLIQASIGFDQLRLKAAFDYQAFLVADITSLDFLMYNVREGTGDRLVAIFDGDAVQVFGTTTSAAQGVALYQALQKLIQERQGNYETSLKEIEKFMKRRSYNTTGLVPHSPPTSKLPEEDTMSKSPISLDTDVVVTLKAVNLGVFPSMFSDQQVFKMEALNAQARFAASIEQRNVHSILGLTLGQLRIGLAGVRDTEGPKKLGEISVEEVVQRATGSRGGTILKVPKVEAVMQTWQIPNSNRIDYIFKSAFEGKVEVGWNYSRISYIRGMWANHSKTLEQTWGRVLPLTAIKVTGVPEAEGEESRKDGEQQKITAEVNVPQSKYEYAALEAPIIETPQLRDMGEATPPLEWIGLHRDRLPNLTHQIVIVSLLELAGEVEDAYSKILGSS